MAYPTASKKTIGISFATQYVELGIQFLGVLVLARILSPNDIGTYSVAAFLMTLLHVFRDFGVVQYIIQERELTTEKIRSAMGVAIILALLVASVLLASSGVIAHFYGKPAIQKILMVMSASFAISPFGSLLIAILRREMKLQEIFYVKTVSAISHVTVALTLALHGFGPISLAWANFAGILSFGIMANLVRPKDIPWLPEFRNIRTILSFGGIASIGNAANIAGTNIPDLVIGKVMNMAAVGYFSRATGLVQLFARLITSALLPLVLPYFAQIRREGKDLAAPYMSAVAQLTVLAWPFFSALMLLAYPMIRALYGPQWDASVPIVKLLCVAGAISSISLFAAQVMVASGQVRNSTYSQLLAQPFRVAAVFIASAFGLQFIAMALIGAELLTLAIVSWFLHKTIKVGPIELIRACGKSAVVTLFSSIVPLLVNLLWPESPAHPWPQLSVGIIGALIGWIGSMVLVRHPLADHLLPLRQPIQKAYVRLKSQCFNVVTVKSVLKILAYRSGLLSAYHCIRNRSALTVVMFHRVLPPSDLRFAGSDPEWTMTPDALRNCLTFFRRHYHIVSPSEAFSALRGELRLPSRSLLITFDDGWADTAEYARAVLEKFGMASLIFVVGSAVNQEAPFWEERVYAFLTTHTDGVAHLAAALERSGIQLSAPMPTETTEKNIRTIIKQLEEIDNTVLDAVTKSLESKGNIEHPAMLSAEQVAQLAASHHVIGGHGMTHRPLTKVNDLAQELSNARGIMANYVSPKQIEAMSFPHGAYSPAVIEQCRAAGYHYLFSSDPCLNVVAKKSNVRPIGRIHLSERALSDNGGRFQAHLLALSLFLRPICVLDQTSGLRNG